MKKTLIIILLLLPAITKATSIIIVMGKDAIYVAADSRSTIFFRDNNGKLDSVYRSICKINHSGNVYFAMAGHADNVVPHIAQESFTNCTNIFDAWNIFFKQNKTFLRSDI